MTSAQKSLKICLINTLAAGLVGSLLALPAQAETLPLPSLSHIHGIAAAEGGGLYLATHDGFFLARRDGAAERLSPLKDDYMGLVSLPGQPGHFYASGHPRRGGNTGLLYSDDGGRNWEQVSPGLDGPADSHVLPVSPVDPKRIYGSYRGLQMSADGGESWVRGGALPARLIALAGSTRSADALYAATEKGLLLSQDAGNSWRPAMLYRLPASLVHVTPQGTAYTFIVGKGLMKTEEPSLAWKPLFNGFGEAVPRHLSVSPDNPQQLYLHDNQGKLWASEDAGQSWARFTRAR